MKFALAILRECRWVVMSVFACGEKSRFWRIFGMISFMVHSFENRILIIGRRLAKFIKLNTFSINFPISNYIMNFFFIPLFDIDLYPHQNFLQYLSNHMKERSRDESPQYRRRSVDRREDRSRQNRNERGQHHHQQEWKREERKPFNQKSQQNTYTQEIAPKINRKETCPFLVRVFYAINNENSFSDPEKLPQNQLKLHLWMNSSLREVAELMRCYLPYIRTKQSFTFWRVHSEQNKEGKDVLLKQELGLVMMHRKNDRVEERYLGNWQFAIGDYLDVSVCYK